MSRRITVSGWHALTPESRELLLATCIDGCGRLRNGRSRCAECNAEHQKRRSRENTARWREKAGQR